MAEIASGVFTLAGTGLSRVLKSTEAFGAAERRANSKVIGGIKKLGLELQFINAMLANEKPEHGDKTIEQYVQYAQSAGVDYGNENFKAIQHKTLRNQLGDLELAWQQRQPWPQWPPVPKFALQQNEDFQRREKRLWEDIATKIEDTVSDNTMQLSKDFTNKYWEFYFDLVKPNADKWHDFIRYKDAEAMDAPVKRPCGRPRLSDEEKAPRAAARQDAELIEIRLPDGPIADHLQRNGLSTSAKITAKEFLAMLARSLTSPSTRPRSSSPKASAVTTVQPRRLETIPPVIVR